MNEIVVSLIKQSPLDSHLRTILSWTSSSLAVCSVSIVAVVYFHLRGASLSRL
jgi:hypothetical protein